MSERATARGTGGTVANSLYTLFGADALEGRVILDVDAYLHLIVNAYRFDEGISLYRDGARLTWTAVNNINAFGTSRLVDLGERGEDSRRSLGPRLQSNVIQIG